MPHVPTPELEHLVHEVILEEAHLTQQGEDGGVAHPLAERGELALHTRANVHHARARHRVVLGVLVLHVLLWHHRKIVGGVRVVRHGRIHAVEHLDGRAEAVSDVVLYDLLRVGDELLPGEHVLRLPRGESGGGGAHGRAGTGRRGVRVEATPASRADGGAAGRGRPIGRAGGGSAERARLLRFRAGRARHRGACASLAGAQRRELQPRGAVRVGDVNHVLRGVHRRPRRARLDRARGRGRLGQPARARMSRLASPPSRESHDGAMRTKLAPLGPSAGSPPRWDARATRRPRGRGASRPRPLPWRPSDQSDSTESLLTPDVDARRKLPPERRARRREAHERTHRTRAGSVRRRAKPSRREKHRPSPRQRSPRGQRRAQSVWIHAPPRPPLPRVPRSRPSLHGLKTQPVPKFGTSDVSAQRVEAPYLDFHLHAGASRSIAGRLSIPPPPPLRYPPTSPAWPWRRSLARHPPASPPEIFRGRATRRRRRADTPWTSRC